MQLKSRYKKRSTPNKSFQSCFVLFRKQYHNGKTLKKQPKSSYLEFSIMKKTINLLIVNCDGPDAFYRTRELCLNQDFIFTYALPIFCHCFFPNYPTKMPYNKISIGFVVNE